EIAALKRRAQALEQQVRRLTKANEKGVTESDGEASSAKTRVSAKRIASQRKRLGLSATDAGLLVGASSQSIYNWEQGKARPLARHLPDSPALKGMGKRAVAARLETLRGLAEAAYLRALDVRRLLSSMRSVY